MCARAMKNKEKTHRGLSDPPPPPPTSLRSRKLWEDQQFFDGICFLAMLGLALLPLALSPQRVIIAFTTVVFKCEDKSHVHIHVQ